VKTKFRLYSRSNGVYYCEEVATGKQESLGTKDRTEAERLFHTKNEAYRQPNLNLQMARMYLSACDPAIAARTWQDVMTEIVKDKTGPSRRRWDYAIKDKAFDLIRDLPILETNADRFLKVMSVGGVATNVHLRSLHNFAMGMNWLPWPVIARKFWPKVHFKEKRAITWEEHRAIVARERNAERRAFYELCWHLGGSQADIANLTAEDIDWADTGIAYQRQKTGSLAVIRFGECIANVLRQRPNSGPLFPYLRTVRSGDRSTEFKQRCDGLGIKGITLHSYRYAWAERAKAAGYPERFAQQALGHNSKAVHRAYARKAKVIVPSLEDYEEAFADRKIIPLDLQTGKSTEAIPLPAKQTSRR
jgi:integrase